MSTIGTSARMMLAFGVLFLAQPLFAAEFLSIEQQVKVGQIITDQHNASPLVGGPALALDAIVPPDVKLEAVPQDAQQMVPRLRGFSYLIVEEQIALVEPHTRRIVEVIPRWRK